MPAPALENQMVDAIKVELAKIGTAPLEVWGTQSPPTIKEGVPKDRVPGPNLMTLYVQHLGSGPGSDSAGTALHQLQCSFQVWCCSSHAADGQRRVRKLLQDVRRALLAAETTFYGLFPYGLRLGEYSFTGDVAWVRGATAIGSLDLTLTGELDIGMNEAQVRALIHQFMMDPSYRRFDLSRAVGAQGGGSAPGVRSVGFTEKPLGLSHYVSLPSGANKIFEVSTDWVVNPGDIPTSAGGGASFNQRVDFSMLINAGSFNSGPATGECLVGIEIGTFGTTTPFQTNYVSAGNGGCIQWRYNHPRAKFELLIWDFDGATPPLVLDATLQPTFGADHHMKWFRIEYVPAAGGGSVIRCYLNGELAITYSGQRLQNLYNTSNPKFLGYFCTNGANGVAITEVGFLESRIWIPDSYLFPTPNPNPA